MEELILSFPDQLKQAIEIGQSIQIDKGNVPIHNILVAGMGGSGIAARINKNVLSNQLGIPFEIVNRYHIPNYVNEHTLFIASSYSGNTEETLSSFLEAIDKGAQIVCITTGGQMEAHAKEQNIPYISIPSGNPPRACLGFSLVQQLYILHQYGLITQDFEAQLQAGIQLLQNELSDIQDQSQQLAKNLKDQLLIMYSFPEYEGVGIRWRQQINENAEMLCWHHVIPEMNHNEIVGWGEVQPNLGVLYLRDNAAPKRLLARLDICKEIISKYSAKEADIVCKGDSILEKSLYWIHFGDWLSLYLCNERGRDPMAIHNIDYLKQALGKI